MIKKKQETFSIYVEIKKQKISTGVCMVIYQLC